MTTDIKLSYYKKVNYATSEETKSLKEINLIIKSTILKKHTDKCKELYAQELNAEDETEREKFKEKRRIYKAAYLPGVTFGGVFKPRNKEMLEGASGLACLDIDDYGKVEDLKKQIMKDKYVSLAFESPTGGLKVVVHIPIVETWQQYENVYYQLLEHYKGFGIEFDEPTRDISRVCFLSYDLDMYVHSLAEIFPADINKEVVGSEKKTEQQATEPGQDKSRSALEYQNVCRLIKRGLSKTDVYKQMLAFEKWKSAPEKYKNFTYDKALNFIKSLKKTPDKERFKTSDLSEGVEEILLNPDLYLLIDKEFDKTIVGEKPTRKNIFFTGCMSFVENCNPTSSNMMVNSPSGEGKDHVTKNSLGIFPKVRVLKRTRISPTVFTYWRPVEDWDGFILYLEDISNEILNHEVFKVMASGGSFATVVINQKAVDIEIKGKPVVILTVASASPSYENLRRFPITNVDGSTNQTKAILKRKMENARNGVTDVYNPKITQALACLKRIKVKIPFAELLIDVLPSDHAIMRTNIDRVLDLIKSSCALYQYQREKDKEGFFLATEQDYENAREIFNETTTNQFSLPITKDQQRIIAELSELGDDWHLFTPDISNKITFNSQDWIRKSLQKLSTYDLIKVKYEKVDGANKPKQFFKVSEINKIYLPQFSIISCRNQINRINTINTIDRINKINKPINSINPILTEFCDPQKASEQEKIEDSSEKLHLPCHYCGLPESCCYDTKGRPVCELCKDNPNIKIEQPEAEK